MAVTLPCTKRGCDYVTPPFEEMKDARSYMDVHVQLDHPTSANQMRSSNERKPEKFPRPTIDLDSTAEAWQYFHTA